VVSEELQKRRVRVARKRKRGKRYHIPLYSFSRPSN
jgi:hypothetical protein